MAVLIYLVKLSVRDPFYIRHNYLECIFAICRIRHQRVLTLFQRITLLRISDLSVDLYFDAVRL